MYGDFMTKNNNPMGNKKIKSLLFSLAIPAMIANVVNALYNIVDQIFIGQGIGYLGNAATSVAFPITTICLCIGLVTGLGASFNFNLDLGRKNPHRAQKITGTAVTTLIISGFILMILVRLFLKDIMIFFGATKQTLAYSMEYAGITSFGLPFFLFTTGFNPIVRADGASKYSMFTILIGAILNIILDPIFIFIFDMGMAGAAWATVISQIVSALFLANYFRIFKNVKFEKEDFIPKFWAIKSIVALGFTSLIFQLSTLVIQISMNNLLRFYGASSIYGSDIPIAIVGIVMKVNILFVSLVLGIVQGAQPIIGFNYGAKKFHRVRETIKVSLIFSTSISLVIFIIFQAFPRQIISLFGSASELYFDYGARFMRFYLAFVFLNGISICITTMFPAMGKARKGALLSLIKQVISLLPLLYILPLFFGLDGIMYATPIADLISFICAVFMLSRELKVMPKEDLS